MFNIPHGIDSAIKKVLADIQSELFAIKKSGGMDTVSSSVTNIYSATGGSNTGRSGTTVLDEINGDFTIHGDLFVDGSIVAGGGMQACLEAITSGSTLCLTDVGGTDQTLTGNLGWLKFDTVSGVDFTDPTIWTNSGTEYAKAAYSNDVIPLFGAIGFASQGSFAIKDSGGAVTIALGQFDGSGLGVGDIDGFVLQQTAGNSLAFALWDDSHVNLMGYTSWGGEFYVGNDGNPAAGLGLFRVNVGTGQVSIGDTYNGGGAALNYTLPTAQGTANQALVCDGSNASAWTTLTGTHVTLPCLTSVNSSWTACLSDTGTGNDIVLTFTGDGDEDVSFVNADSGVFKFLDAVRMDASQHLEFEDASSYIYSDATGLHLYDNAQVKITPTSGTPRYLNLTTTNTVFTLDTDATTGLEINAPTAISLSIGGTQQVRLLNGVIRPITDNDIDLGAHSTDYYFKDLYLKGKAYFGDTGSYIYHDGTNMAFIENGTQFSFGSAAHQYIDLIYDITILGALPTYGFRSSSGGTDAAIIGTTTFSGTEPYIALIDSTGTLSFTAMSATLATALSFPQIVVQDVAGASILTLHPSGVLTVPNGAMQTLYCTGDTVSTYTGVFDRTSTSATAAPQLSINSTLTMANTATRSALTAAFNSLAVFSGTAPHTGQFAGGIAGIIHSSTQLITTGTGYQLSAVHSGTGNFTNLDLLTIGYSAYSSGYVTGEIRGLKVLSPVMAGAPAANIPVLAGIDIEDLTDASITAAYGIRSNTDMVALDGVKWSFGTGLDVSISNDGTADELLISPGSAANAVVTFTHTGTGGLMVTESGGKLGFFGATPVVQRPKASYNNWAAFTDVVDALVDLGLFDAA